MGDRNLLQDLETMPGVEQAVPISKTYKLASRTVHEENSIVKVGNVELGKGNFTVIAGPCGVESREQIMQSAECVKNAGDRKSVV